MIFYEDGLRGAAADCFDADRAGAGENVKEAGTWDVGPENVEEGFAQTIAGRAEGIALEGFEDAAAIFAGDDAHIGLANFGQMIPPLPLAGEAAQEAVQDELLRRGVGDGEGFAAGLLQEFAVAQRVGDVEAEGSGLAGTEEFAGAAELQI